MIPGRKDIRQEKRIKLIILIFLFFCATNCSAQLNEFTCTAPINEWKFVLQLRKDSVFKYEAFSKYGRWDFAVAGVLIRPAAVVGVRAAGTVAWQSPTTSRVPA